MRRDHQDQIEALRGEQAQQLEAYRAAIATRSGLAQKRITAYENVYRVGIKTSTELAILERRGTAEAQNIQHGLLLEFAAVWEQNRLFLGPHSIGKINEFIARLREDSPGIGGAQSLATFRRDVNSVLDKLRRDMQTEIAREASLMNERPGTPKT